VTNVPIVNASFLQKTEEMDSALGTIKLGSMGEKD
jgi:hypothetical protein